MLILAVDTSTRQRSLALLRDDSVLAEVSDTEQSPYSERLFRDLKALQDYHPFQVSEVDVFAVASGPGSFTGLRVGLAAVKGWAEVYRKPIVAVSALEAIAAQSEQASGLIAAYFDARRGQVFGALYRQRRAHSLEREGDEVLLPAADYLADLKNQLGNAVPKFVSPSPTAIPDGMIETVFAGAQVEQVSSSLARFIGRLGFARAARGEVVDALTLEANYVRRSDAEVFQKGN